MQIQDLLNRLLLDDLKSIAHHNNLPDKGMKSELISVILGANLPPERILEFSKIVSLKRLLANEGLPRTGRKSELEKRLLSILEKPKLRSKGATAYYRGHGFEEQVASWARKHFKDANPRVRTGVSANGLSVKRPYEIDVHMQTKGKGIFGRQADVWIECKWKEKSSVKRTDIMKLVASAQDVYRAARAGREVLYYNGLILASNQRFDSDALNYANQEDVLCIRFDGKKCEEQNPEAKWLGESAWLRRVE